MTRLYTRARSGTSNGDEIGGGELSTDDFLRQLVNVGEVDILVGLPLTERPNDRSIVQTIQSGILRGFPREQR